MLRRLEFLRNIYIVIKTIKVNHVYFTEILPTEHYLEEHARSVPWEKVVEIILTTKNPRRKGNKIEIQKDGFYILCEVKNHILYVINAK